MAIKAVNISYRLSKEGQRAAVIADHPFPPHERQAYTMQWDSTDTRVQVTDLDITSDGILCYNAPRNMKLDTLPADLADLVARSRAWKEAEEQRKAREQAEYEERHARHLAESAARMRAAAAETYTRMLERWKSDPDSFDSLVESPYRYSDGIGSDTERIAAAELVDTINGYVRVRKLAAGAAIREAWSKDRSLPFQVSAAGYASFRDWDGKYHHVDLPELWEAGQSRRWIGHFTSGRKIDQFLENPKRESAWDVGALAAGDCIQGGGHDVNSRGKRRYETSWFAVVTAVGDGQIRLRFHKSRVECLDAARALREEQERRNAEAESREAESKEAESKEAEQTQMRLEQLRQLGLESIQKGLTDSYPDRGYTTEEVPF